MQIERIWPADAVLEWHRVGPTLRAALRRDNKGDLEVLQKIVVGDFQCWRVSGDEATGVVVTSVGAIKGTLIRAQWIIYAAGRASGGPKSRLQIMRRLKREFEAIARSERCAEMRAEDRSAWRHVLDDYELTTKPNGGCLLRRAL